MNPTPEHLKHLLAQARRPLGVHELLKLAGLHPGQQTQLKRTLRDLVRGGQILKEGKRFRLSQPPPAAREERFARGPSRHDKHKGPPARGGGFQREKRFERGGRFQQRGRGALIATLEGVLHVHRDGFGFVHPLSGEGENIFLPPHEASRALDNDRVRVEVSQDRTGRTEGRILEVLDRRRELVVGTYTEQGRHAAVYPNDSSLPGPVRVPRTQMARDGDLVKVRLGVGARMLGPGDALYGEVAGSLGRPGDPSAEVLSVAYAQGFSDEFPPEVMDEADRVGLEVTEEEARGEGRRDLRSLPLVTIDGEDARDFDDAVYVEPRGGGWRLVVAIADVTHYVREHQPLDGEAFRRATSVYLPDRVLPMLPERLSNGICSLRPDEDRLCMVADMVFDASGQRRSSEMYPAVMRSVARCTYNEVQDVLDGKDVPHRNAFRSHFENLLALSRTLTRMRKARGAIDFDLPEHKVVMGEDGLPARMDKRERKDSHRLIEECMLAANEAVARFFQDEGLPTVYRFHGEPDEEKLAAFATLAEAFGFKFHFEDGISSKELNAFISQLEGHSEQRALNQLLLRSMMQAVYSASQVGHYGLAAEHYLHFTSPIRRYPDLLVHRLLKAHWARKGRKPAPQVLEREEDELEEMAAQCSERERAAMQVEREVVSFYACLLMKDRVGQEFDATVSSVTDFGFFVELDIEHVEGLIKTEALGFGGKFDKALLAIVYPDGRRVRVGQKLRARLVSVNTQRRQMDFEAVSFEGQAVRAPERLERQPKRHEERRPKRFEERQPPHREERRHKRFVREGQREQAAPSKVERKQYELFTPPGLAPRIPAPSDKFKGKGRRFVMRAALSPEPAPEQEVREVQPPEVPVVPPAPAAPLPIPEVLHAAPVEVGPVVPEAAEPSAHPGFDRIRALASQGKGKAKPAARKPAPGKPSRKAKPARKPAAKKSAPGKKPAKKKVAKVKAPAKKALAKGKKAPAKKARKAPAARKGARAPGKNKR
ncbi:ribonuclease R [Myxococcaceae bacterium GXIMD 01537]